MKLTTKMHFTQEMHKNSVTYVFMIPDGSWRWFAAKILLVVISESSLLRTFFLKRRGDKGLQVQRINQIWFDF